MNIQQSLNQALFQGQIAAGLYAHSPAGKEQAEISRIKKNMPRIQKQIELAGGAVSPESSAATDKAFTEAFQQGTEQSKRLYELAPSKKTFKQYNEMAETLEEWESTLIYSQDKRQKTLADQKAALKMREELLKGAPEVPVKRTKVEVDYNGK